MIGKRPHAAASAAVPQQQPPASAAEAEASVALESQMEGQLEQSLPSSVPRKLYALKRYSSLASIARASTNMGATCIRASSAKMEWTEFGYLNWTCGINVDPDTSHLQVFGKLIVLPNIFHHVLVLSLWIYGFGENRSSWEPATDSCWKVDSQSLLLAARKSP